MYNANLRVQGYVGGLSDIVLKVYYLPRSPGRFKHAFNIRVGHFEPDTLRLFGDAIYPNLTLALPRDHSDQHRAGFTELLDQAVEHVKRRVNNLDPTTSEPQELLPYHHAVLDTGHMPLALANKVSIEDYLKAGYDSVCVTLIGVISYILLVVISYSH